MILYCYEETDMSKFFFSKDVGGEKNPNKVVSYLVWTDAYKEANPNHSITTKFMAKRKFATWFKENYPYELDYSEGNNHIRLRVKEKDVLCRKPTDTCVGAISSSGVKRSVKNKWTKRIRTWANNK